MTLQSHTPQTLLALLSRFAKHQQRVDTSGSTLGFHRDEVARALGYPNWSQLHKNFAAISSRNFDAVVKRADSHRPLGAFLTMLGPRSVVLAAESLRPQPYQSPDDQMRVLRIRVGLAVGPQPKDLAEPLAASIEDAARFYNHGHGTTVWLDVNTTNESIPDFVTSAIARLEGFGVGLVVTKGQETSVNPTEIFGTPLLEAIQNAARSGMIWDPVSNELVFTTTRW